MSEFTDQSVYSKHQADCDCGDDSNCTCSKSDCGCCPPGLVAVKNCDGDISCLTPNDASCLTTETHIPLEGYVKLYDPVSGVYLGDVTVAESLAYISAIDPDIDAPTAGNLYNITTQDSVALVAPPDTETRDAAVTFGVDRISCDEDINVSLSGAPAGVTFLGGAVELNIPANVSEIIDGIQITDVIDAGNYNITVVYDGCDNAKSKTLILNVS